MELFDFLFADKLYSTSYSFCVRSLHHFIIFLIVSKEEKKMYNDFEEFLIHEPAQSSEHKVELSRYFASFI